MVYISLLVIYLKRYFNYFIFCNHINMFVLHSFTYFQHSA